MVIEVVLFSLLTLVAAGVGTLTGFGTSTIMVPVVLLFFPLPITLLFVGIIHWFGDIWKILLFTSGIRWRLLIFFGGAGIATSYLGASLVVAIPEHELARVLGVFLLAYVGWLWLRPQWKLPDRDTTALAGGLMSGFLAGIFGVGGSVRGAFLAAYNLPKEVYLFTSGAIALIIDSTRLATYWSQGIRLPSLLLVALVASIPASLLGAYLAKRIVNRIPQRTFRFVVALFLTGVGIKLLIWT